MGNLFLDLFVCLNDSFSSAINTIISDNEYSYVLKFIIPVSILISNVFAGYKSLQWYLLYDGDYHHLPGETSRNLYESCVTPNRATTTTRTTYAVWFLRVCFYPVSLILRYFVAWWYGYKIRREHMKQAAAETTRVNNRLINVMLIKFLTQCAEASNLRLINIFMGDSIVVIFEIWLIFKMQESASSHIRENVIIIILLVVIIITKIALSMTLSLLHFITCQKFIMDLTNVKDMNNDIPQPTSEFGFGFTCATASRSGSGSGSASASASGYAAFTSASGCDYYECEYEYEHEHEHEHVPMSEFDIALRNHDANKSDSDPPNSDNDVYPDSDPNPNPDPDGDSDIDFITLPNSFSFLSRTAQCMICLWQFLCFISQLTAYAMLFTNTLSLRVYEMFIFIGIRWIIHFLWLMFGEHSEEDEDDEDKEEEEEQEYDHCCPCTTYHSCPRPRRCSSSLSCVTCIIFASMNLFSYLTMFGGTKATSISFYYFIVFLFNICVIMTFLDPISWTLTNSMTIYIGIFIIFGAFILGLSCMISYYCCCHPHGDKVWIRQKIISLREATAPK